MSYERTPKDLAPLGAEPGGRTSSRQANPIALLQSFGVKIRPAGYEHLALLERSDRRRSVAVPS